MNDDGFREEIIERLDRIEKALNAKTAKANAKAADGEVADDFDLDGKYGNEPIKRDPSAKYWSGDSFVGKTMSECTAEYLDALAKWNDAKAYMTEKEADPEKQKYAGYNRKSARRARGWAKRVRDGHPSTNANSDDLFSDSSSSDDIPF